MPEKFFDFQQGLNALSKPTDIGDLVALRRWIPYCGDPKRLRVLASALPETLAGLAHEQSLELAHIAMELAAYSPTIACGLASLPVRLQVQWRRAQWCAGVFSEECSEKQFLQTIAGWGGKERSHSEVLLKRALCAEDSRLRSFALENISVSVQQLRISASLGFCMIESLCRDSEPALRIRAFDAFHTPWHLHVSLQEKGRREACIERALFDDTPSVALAAARCAIRLGLSQPLRAAYLNTECALSVRAFIVTEFAPMATRNDLKEVLSLPEEEPLAFLAAIRSFVLDAHRHGLFLRSCDLETILDLYDSHSAWQAEELVRVTYVERNALNSLLATLDANDERWLRRSKILSVGYGEAPSKLLSILLQTCTDSRIASNLLGAASECAAFDDVDSLLCWWKECPQEVIPALRAEVDWAGSTKAKQALWSLLEAPLTPSTLRKQALEVFWCLTTERSAILEKLATLLGPDESQLLRFLKTEDTPLKGDALLAQMPWPEASSALDPWLRFKAICHSHDSRLRGSVVEQFRELFLLYVSLALQGDFSVKRIQMPLLEQQLFAYGRNLISSERCVRSWNENSTETGRDFVLLVALEWLREEPEEAIVVALLELVARHAPNGAVLRAIEPYWRHRHKGVQRAGIAAILSAGEAARGLEVSICRLGESDDARILCQVYEAVEKLGAVWAAGMVVKGLEHEKMSVKKSAADALAVVGSPPCISALIFWLGKHDNDGFRQSLKRALVKATEDNAHLPLLEALEGEENPRTIELLWDALCGILSLPLVVRLASSDSESKCAIVQACLDGTIGLQGASRDALALSLHRAEKRTIVEKKTSPRDEICIQGFSDKAAQRFIDASEETFDNKDLQWIKSRFSDWVHWVCSQISPSVKGTSLLLRAANQDDAVHFSAILNCAGNLKKNLTMKAFLEFVRNCHIGFDAKCRVQAIKILCDFPPNVSIGGLSWFELLGSLGAFRTGNVITGANYLDFYRLGSGNEECCVLTFLLMPERQLPFKNVAQQLEGHFSSKVELRYTNYWIKAKVDEHQILVTAKSFPYSVLGASTVIEIRNCHSLQGKVILAQDCADTSWFRRFIFADYVIGAPEFDEKWVISVRKGAYAQAYLNKEVRQKIDAVPVARAPKRGYNIDVVHKSYPYEYYWSGPTLRIRCSILENNSERLMSAIESGVAICNQPTALLQSWAELSGDLDGKLSSSSFFSLEDDLYIEFAMQNVIVTVKPIMSRHKETRGRLQTQISAQYHTPRLAKAFHLGKRDDFSVLGQECVPIKKALAEARALYFMSDKKTVRAILAGNITEKGEILAAANAVAVVARHGESTSPYR